MKSNGLSTLLQGALAVCLLACVIFCVQFIFLTRELRQLQVQLNGINAWRSSVQAFAADCVAYSKQNPAILPILETIGLHKNDTKPAK